MAEFKICNKCCKYTDSFVDGLGECIECINYEPRLKRVRKKYPKLNKQVFSEKFRDHQARAKEKIERRRMLRRKERFIL